LTMSALPTMALPILPVGTAVAIFGGLSFLNSDRELIALSAAGLSDFQIAKPALKLAAYACVVCYLCAFYIAPKSYHFLKKSLGNFRNNFVANVLHEKSFNQLSKNLTLYIGNKNDDGIMEEMIIFDNRDKRESSIIFARNGQIKISNNHPSFILSDGMRQIIDAKGNMNQMTFSSLQISIPQGNTERAIHARDLQEFTIWHLMFPDQSISKSKVKQMKTEIHQRIIWPFYCIIFTMICIGIYLKNPHKRTEDYKSAIHLALTLITIIYLHFTFYNMASSSHFFIALCYFNVFCSFLYGYKLLKK